MNQRTPLTDFEKSIAAKLCSASFPPGTASKRFVRNLGDGYINIKELSDKGADIHGVRRQSFPPTIRTHNRGDGMGQALAQ